MILKGRLNLISFSLIACFAFGSCSDAPKGDKVSVTGKQQAAAVSGDIYSVDTSASNVRFTGHGVGKNHPGKFHLSSGEFAVVNKLVTGGKFVIDINSMMLEQQDPMIQNKLRPHLLSPDFFDAAKFSTSTFEITNVSTYIQKTGDASKIENANCDVSGNLSLKGITKNISFPARIDVNNNSVKASANFDINRTDWQINYGNDKSLGDKFISETVNVEINVLANRK